MVPSRVGPKEEQVVGEATEEEATEEVDAMAAEEEATGEVETMAADATEEKEGGSERAPIPQAGPR